MMKYNIGDMFTCEYGEYARAIMLIIGVKNDVYVVEHNCIDKKTGFQRIQQYLQDANHLDAVINIGKHLYLPRVK